MQLITYYAATIYQNEMGLDPFTLRILAAASGTGKVRSMALLYSRSHRLPCFQNTLLLPGAQYSPLRSLGAAN